MLRNKPSLQSHHRFKALEIVLIKKLYQKQKIRRMKSRQNQLSNKFQRLLLSLKQIGMLSRTKMKISSHIFKIFRHRRLSLSLKSQRSPPKYSAEFSILYLARISIRKLIRNGWASSCLVYLKPINLI